MNGKDICGVKCFIFGVVMTTVIFGLAELANAQELLIIKDGDAIIAWTKNS